MLGDLDDEPRSRHVGRLEEGLQGPVAHGGRAQVQGQVAAGKVGEVGEGGLDDGQVEGCGQAQLLTHAEAVLGGRPVVEAAQGLHTGHVTRVEVDDGLVHEVEAVALDHGFDHLAVTGATVLHWLADVPTPCF